MSEGRYQDKSIWEASAYYPDAAINKSIMKWQICFPQLKLSAGIFHWSSILKKKNNKNKTFLIFFSTKYTQFVLQTEKKKVLICSKGANVLYPFFSPQS